MIRCELLNGKVDGTWVFTETNYYQFDSSYQNLDGWEAIHECYIGFSDGVHWISAKYDVQDQAFTLLTGEDYVKLKAGPVENDTALDLSVIFKFYFKATLFDTQDIDIHMKATQVDGTASEWSIVEENLFKPVSLRKGFVEIDEFGNEILLYPRLSFTRLAIYGNTEYFEQVFSLYSKGSISLDYVLELLNIDPEDANEKIKRDLFTVADSKFNDIITSAYAGVGVELPTKTNLVNIISEYLGLELKGEEGEEGEAVTEAGAEEARF